VPHVHRSRLFKTLASQGKIGSSHPHVNDISHRGDGELLRKHPKSVTNWLNKGLRFEGNDSELKTQLDHLDAAFSWRNERKNSCGHECMAPYPPLLRQESRYRIHFDRSERWNQTGDQANTREKHEDEHIGRGIGWLYVEQ